MIFITGSTGCVGSYFLDDLTQESISDIHLLVRRPQELKAPYFLNARVHVIHGDLQNISEHSALLSRAEYVFHFATSWGGPDAFEINDRAFRAILDAVSFERCRRVVYFSTASIIKPTFELDMATFEKGTEYIRSKAYAYQRLNSHEKYPLVTAVFPSVILGGDAQHAWTPFTRSIKHWSYGLSLAKHLGLDGVFHWIHARDIAQILTCYLKEQNWPKHVVLGQPADSVQALIQKLSPQPPRFRVPFSSGPMLSFLSPWMTPWDRHSFLNQHVYPVAYPEQLGLQSHYGNFQQVYQDYSS